MSTAQETKSLYLELCLEKEIDVNQECLFLICQEEEKDEFEPDSRIIHLHGNKRNEKNEIYRNRINDKELGLYCSLFKTCTYLNGIDLGYNLITDEGGKIIGTLLEETVALQTLIISYNDIGVFGTTAIARGIQMNETLLTLKMDGNKFGRVGGLALAGALQVNTTLEELDITNTEQDTQSLIALATVLKANTSVKILHAGRPILHSYQEETTIHFAKMLEVNRRIVEIHLPKHGITNFGVEQLTNHMVDNFTLLHLDLSCNQISRDGIKAISTFLMDNPPLRVLNVAYNRAEDDGAIALSDALSNSNLTLETLVLCSNSLTGKGLCALTKALAINSVLKQLYIWGNHLDTPACQAFKDVMKGDVPRLLAEDTDVKPYVVDDVPYLARVSSPY